MKKSFNTDWDIKIQRSEIGTTDFSRQNVTLPYDAMLQQERHAHFQS
ncbi:hypothetical protein RB620_12150 [Paenibacillus sp. LHD-117]|nr:hypothetical protein [Paenibacillus sp. LHD-117]MDQ6420189.1 hypothetical protein [Paenibacillus sp. LHD-117]